MIGISQNLILASLRKDLHNSVSNILHAEGIVFCLENSLNISKEV